MPGGGLRYHRPGSVAALVGKFTALGSVTSVIHTAGVSPSMGAADLIMRINAIGTVNVDEGFFGVAGKDVAFVNVASRRLTCFPE